MSSGCGRVRSESPSCVRLVVMSVSATLTLFVGSIAGPDCVATQDVGGAVDPNSPSSPPLAPQNVVAAFELGGCGGCHTIPGVPGADGDVGPDLSHMRTDAGRRRPGYSARQYIRESITNPDEFIAANCPDGDCPSGVMLQSFAESLSPADLDAIVNYLAEAGSEVSTSPESSPASRKLAIELPSEAVLNSFAPPPAVEQSTARIVLGRYLFFDRRLSGNNSLSCSSCHDPQLAFTDGRRVSRGYPSTQLFRNTPSLLNASRSRRFYLDGRLGDLPTVVRDHLTEAHFMAMDGRLMVERLRQIPPYVELFERAFGGAPTFGRTLDAVAAYVGILNSPPTPYDRYRSGEVTALSAEARAGLKLFRGRANCVRCHTEPLLTDGRFYRLGVPEDPMLLDDPERHMTFRRFFRIFGYPNYRGLRTDPGRQAVTLTASDAGRFRTPALREVGRTAPYMHNGAFSTLDEVVDFYNAKGGADQTADLRPLGLTAVETGQLVAFLKSLSSPALEITTPVLPAYELLAFDDRIGIDESAVATISIEPPPLVERPPPLGPLPPVSHPPDNPLTPEKVDLGRLLYFDPRMSGDGSISCNSCHPVTTGWTIHTPISMGGTGTSHWRNSQSILNVGHYGKLNWDGAQPSIEKQNAGAWSGAVAGNLDPALAEERIAQIPEYVRRFREVFGTDDPVWENALRALAAFQRTLNSRNVPFDRYLEGDRAAISAAAKRGHELFTGRAGCITCHHGPLASDDSYHNIGVPQSATFGQSPLRQITFRFELASKGVPLSIYQNATRDDGLYYVTKRPEDRGRFRTPGLRDLTQTAPYMHHGIFTTLEEVVDFYNQGGGDDSAKSPLIRPLSLTVEERSDLVTFLRTLSGDSITVDRPELPPYGRFPATSGGPKQDP